MNKRKKSPTKRVRKLYKQRETDTVTALKALGLSEAETRTYLAILEQPGSVAAIARTAGLRRSLVYSSLPGLEARGLASILPRGKRLIYVAEPPDRLASLANRNVEGIAALLPALEMMYRRPGGAPSVRLVQGVEAIRALHDHMVDTLGKGETYYRFSSTKFRDGERKYITPSYKARRDAKQLQRFIISSIESAKDRTPKLNREVKIVPVKSKSFDYNITLIVYGTTVELIDYNSDLAIVIDDKMVAAFVKHIFLLLYDRLPEGGS